MYPQGPNRMARSVEDRLLERLKSIEARLAGVERRGSSATWSGAITPHASSHFTGGSDALSPADIGAATDADMTAAEGDISNLQTDVGNLQIDVGDLQTDVGDLQTDVGDLQTDVGDLQTDVGDLQTDVGDLQTDVGALETGLERKTTTQTITVAAGAEAEVNLNLHTAFNLWQIETNKAARIRIYTTTAERTADNTRAVGNPPAEGAGLITEVITTGALLTVPMCPAQSGASLASPASTSIPALIKNNGTSNNVTLTIKWSRAER
jgi:chromosome segregation ATPase